jgi:hypothetical protein
VEVDEEAEERIPIIADSSQAVLFISQTTTKACTNNPKPHAL